jgi:hypothetical protein
MFFKYFFESINMSFNSSVFIPAAVVAVVGAVILSFVDFQISGAVLFAAGAIIAGLANSFSGSSEESAASTTTLYVGNLPYRANEGSVRDLFSEYGTVFSVRLLRDKQTGKRRGFGFVEVASSDSKKVIDTLNDFEFQERMLKVRLANDK